MTATARDDHVFIRHIVIPPDRARTALEPEGIAELAESIDRLGLMHRIALHERPNDPHQYTLIAGARRLAACKHLGWHGVDAKVYPADMSEREARVIELEENYRRADLTPGERHAHAAELLALIREADEAGAQSRELPEFAEAPPGGETRELPDFTPTTGRGHRGAISKVAEHLGKDPSTVRHHLKRAGETIGETIDPAAPAAKLRDQANRASEAARDLPRRRPSPLKPKPIDGDREQPKAKRNLLDVMGALVAWSPAAAQQYVREHPDEAKRIADCAGSVAAIANAVAKPKSEGQRLDDGEFIRSSVDRIEEYLATGRVSPGAVQIMGAKAQELALRYWRHAGQGRLPAEEPQEATDATAADDQGEVDMAAPGQPEAEEGGKSVEEELDELGEQEDELSDDLGDDLERIGDDLGDDQDETDLSIPPAPVERLDPDALRQLIQDVVVHRKLATQARLCALATDRGPVACHASALSSFMTERRPRLPDAQHDQIEATCRQLLAEKDAWPAAMRAGR